ncbi:unnamed protein product [Coregonus sp. 'balchen']|nr:unnamed protein product [Coregonus sp. 'balchen']
MLAFLVGLLYLVSGRTVRAQDATGSRFFCSAIPAGSDPSCSFDPNGNRVQSTSPVEDELRNTILQLRETILQQKETIVSQQGTIKELNSKLARCEAAAEDTAGRSRGQSSRRKDYNQRQQQLRANTSVAAAAGVGGNAVGPLPAELRELLKHRLGALEGQLLRKVAELEEEKSQLYNETAAHRQRTESTLTSLLERITELERISILIYPGQRITELERSKGYVLTDSPSVSILIYPGQRITELERSNNAFKSPEDFKVSLPLRTNYLYGRIKKSLPEMYAFTVCMWLKSSASPGIGTPFSYGVPGQANEIVLIEWGNNPIELLVNDKDGERLGTGENLAPWHPIKPGGVIILGQEQVGLSQALMYSHRRERGGGCDIVGGRFDATQAFVGELSQFNMWDRVLRPVDIMGMANCSSYMPGNVVPWIDTNVEVMGGASKAALEICEDRMFEP